MYFNILFRQKAVADPSVSWRLGLLGKELLCILPQGAREGVGALYAQMVCANYTLH
jgi:hypothetical protein